MEEEAASGPKYESFANKKHDLKEKLTRPILTEDEEWTKNAES